MMVDAVPVASWQTNDRLIDGRRGLPIVFGPVRSRRLGWSLGINNVPAKTCTYSCVYCQVGATDRARLERAVYIEPAEIIAAVGVRLEECRRSDQPIDYATFVPDGEPTLDLGLLEAISGVAGLGLKVAVLTNGSLLWRPDVRAELTAADWVSVKVDTVDGPTWRRLNRPIGNLQLEAILAGMRRFTSEYGGDLVTETMIVAGINDDDETIRHTAAFVKDLKPCRAYIAIPTRPPADPWVRAPTTATVARAADIFRTAGIPTELLVEDVVDAFAPSVDPATGLLGIVAVHPMTVSDARDYLERSGGDWSIVEDLIESGRVHTVRFGGDTYLRATLSRSRRWHGRRPGVIARRRMRTTR